MKNYQNYKKHIFSNSKKILAIFYPAAEYNKIQITINVYKPEEEQLENKKKKVFSQQERSVSNKDF